MKHLWLAGVFLLLASPLQAQDSPATPPIVVTPITTAHVTASGQPIVLPQKDAEIVVATYDIAPGATLPEHKHPLPRYAYVLSGTLRVSNIETGKSDVYKTGDFIVEAVDQWHKAANIGSDPVKLLVIDMTERGQNNVVKK